MVNATMPHAGLNLNPWTTNIRLRRRNIQAKPQPRTYTVLWGRFHKLIQAYMFSPIRSRVNGARMKLDHDLSSNPLGCGSTFDSSGSASDRTITVDNLSIRYRVTNDSVEVQELRIQD